MNIRTAVFVCLACSWSAGALAQETGNDIYKGDAKSRLDALAHIQPGLGVVMHEIGYRATAAYKAANGGNWGLAQYELHELLEAQEVGEATRPQHAQMLKAFEHANFPPILKAVENKDLDTFNQHFASTVEACNACHIALGHAYIKYQLPTEANAGGLDFNFKTDPTHDEEKEQ
jgi:hypothetical protein